MAKVAVFGAGMAGLSAAHELRKLPGFEVTVYESSDRIGGKSKNQYGGVLPSGTNGREPLPGEHGFRFFPGFYRNIIETMRDIPAAPPGDTAGRLADSDDVGLAKSDIPFLTFPRHARISNLGDVVARMFELYEHLDFHPQDIYRMAWFRIKYLTSCHDRRLDYDRISWWRFVDAESPLYTPQYREFEAAIPRTMSALVAQKSSALVVGDVTMQFLLDTPDESAPDRLLDGPTDEAWLNPWFDYLTGSSGGQEVEIIFKKALVRLEMSADGQRIAAAYVEASEGPAIEEKVEADYYLVAVPVERFVPLISDEMREADEQLDRLAAVYVRDDWTGWMSGAQIGLAVDQPMVSGHTFYPSSPWALTSISQAQFWKQRGKLEDRFGDGKTRGVLSVIISDWEGNDPDFEPAKSMTSRAELLDTLMDQLRNELQNSDIDLRDTNITFKHLDDGMQTNGPGAWSNETPLLLHPEKAYLMRPEPDSKIDNLFLASDFVRTEIKLATMEGANEAARRAVGAIAEREDLPIKPPWFPLREPETLLPFKGVDELMKIQGRPHVMDQFPLNLLLHAPGLVPFLPHIMDFIERVNPDPR